ncbi:MAG: hypothetical protein AAF223_08755, partial [Bacteroidota bacterium]
VMKKIEPYKNVIEAVSTLDNGGRFYNILTKTDDGIISGSELGKVAGLFSDKQKMILFFELSVSKLDQADREEVVSKLDSKLQKAYQRYKPQKLSPSEANATGVASSNAIITGIPTLVESKTDLLGFIMVPIITDKATTFTMVPLMEKYDVYEMRDEPASDTFLIAHARSSQKLPQRKITVAGVLKELKSHRNEAGSTKIFLESIYHLEIE